MSGLPEKKDLIVDVVLPGKKAKVDFGKPSVGRDLTEKEKKKIRSVPETPSPLRGSYRTASELEKAAAAAEEAERLRRREGLRKVKTEKKNPDIIGKPKKSPVAKGKKLETPEEHEEEMRKYEPLTAPSFAPSLSSVLPEEEDKEESEEEESEEEESEEEESEGFYSGLLNLFKGDFDVIMSEKEEKEVLNLLKKETSGMNPEEKEKLISRIRGEGEAKKSPEKKESRSFFGREKMSMFRSSKLPERREMLSKDKKSLGPRAKGDRGIAYDIETDQGEINIYNGSGFSNPIYYFVNGDKTDKDDFAERLTMFLDFNKFPTVQIQKAGYGGLDEVPNSGYVIEGIKKLVGIKSVGPNLIKQMEDDLKFRLDAAMRNGQTKASIKIAKEIEKFNKNRKILEDSIKKGEVAIKDPYKDRKFEGSDNVYQLPVAESDIISILKANGIDSAQARDFVGTLMNSGYARAIDEMIKAKKDKPAEGADSITVSAYRIVRGSIPGRKPTKERSVLPDRLKKNTYLQEPNAEEVITYTRDDRAKYYDEADVRRGNEIYKDKVRTEIIDERINQDNRPLKASGLQKVKANIEKGLDPKVVAAPSSSSSSSSSSSFLSSELNPEDYD